MKRTSLLLLIFSMILAVAAPACAGEYQDISPKEVKELIDSNEKNFLLLDVRTPGEYRRGHLKNVKLIPVQVLGDRVNEIADFKDKKVIVYCAVGGRSSRASAYLKSRGFKKVYNMSGGIRAWTDLGYEIVR